MEAFIIPFNTNHLFHNHLDVYTQVTYPSSLYYSNFSVIFKYGAMA